MDLHERRELNNGFGDGLSRAFELVLTPMVVGGLGLLLDRWLGTVPLFTVVFAFWGLGATTYLTWIRYEADMRRHEDERSAGEVVPSPAAGGPEAVPAARRGRARSIATHRQGLGALDA